MVFDFAMGLRGVFIFGLCCIIPSFAYIIPEIRLEVFKTKGFKVSIPDQNGIRVFGFHGRVNQQINGRERGLLYGDVSKPKHGFWTFIEPNVKLRAGDILSYWTYVCFFDGDKKTDHVNDNKIIEVTKEHFVDEDFVFPEIKLEVFRPKGFRVSIPDQDGIKLFSFHGKVNKKMRGREDGTYSKKISEPDNGAWSIFEPYAKLNIGDILYYWAYVGVFDGEEQTWFVTDDKKIKIVQDHIVGYHSLGLNMITEEKRNPIRNTAIIKPVNECPQSLTTVNGAKQCKDTLLFNEDFNILDHNRWKAEIRFAGEPDYEFVVYTDNPQVLNVESGKLVISPTLSENLFGENFVNSREEYNFGRNCTAELQSTDCVQKAEAFLIKPPVVSAQISTKESFSFRYGTIEFKAKLPKGDWIYPEIYLNSKDEKYGPFYESGRIILAFCQGNDNSNKILYGGCILGDTELARSHFMKNIRKTSNSAWSDDFNIFSVTWTDQMIAFYVNGNRYGTVYSPEGGFASLKEYLSLNGAHRWRNSNSIMAPFDQEMFITLGVGVGGHNFADGGLKPWNNSDPKSQKNFFRHKNEWYPTWNTYCKMEVEYIKVFSI